MPKISTKYYRRAKANTDSTINLVESDQAFAQYFNNNDKNKDMNINEQLNCINLDNNFDNIEFDNNILESLETSDSDTSNNDFFRNFNEETFNNKLFHNESINNDEIVNNTTNKRSLRSQLATCFEK